jgi:hypothetical protein
MIQRIQSIWLLLASLTILCLLFIPLVSSNDYYILVSGLYQKVGADCKKIEGYLPLLITTIAVAVISFVNIFNFKNRTTQKRIILVNIVFIIGLAFWCSVYAKKLPGGLENGSYGVGIFLPVIAILFCLMAKRGIDNDEKLIRSADRLR